MSENNAVTLDLPRLIKHPYAHGTEYFVHPSELARKIWLCTRCFGQARHSAGFRMGDDASEDYWRVRQGYLLHFIIKGNFWHRIGDHTHMAKAGEACLIDLSGKVAMGNSGPSEARLYWACFDGRDAPRLFAELRADFDPVYKGIDNRRMTALFKDLIRLGETTPPALEPQIAGTLTLMLAQLLAARGPTVSFAGGTQGRILSAGVRRAVEYVSRRYDQSVSVKSMAYDTGQNPEQLSRVFRRELNMTPTEFLMQFRIEQAKRMLEDTQKPIKQIAHAAGFPDENYFTRIFTKLTGQTPRRYRSTPRPTSVFPSTQPKETSPA